MHQTEFILDTDTPVVKYNMNNLSSKRAISNRREAEGSGTYRLEPRQAAPPPLKDKICITLPPPLSVNHRLKSVEACKGIVGVVNVGSCMEIKTVFVIQLSKPKTIEHFLIKP